MLRQEERVIRLDQLLRNRDRTTAQYLADELEVSERTVRSDIEFLRERLHAPILKSKKQGYYYEDPNWRLSTYPTSACAIGLVTVENNIITQQNYYLIRPPTPEFIFTHIHGITWPDVATAPIFQQLWPQITKILNSADFFAAHNAKFDQNILQSCCKFYHLPCPTPEFICTVQLARQTWNIRPTKLPNVCSYLNIELNHHHALSDAQACAQIVIQASLTEFGNHHILQEILASQ